MRRYLPSLIPLVLGATLAATGISVRNRESPDPPPAPELPPSAAAPVVRQAFDEVLAAEARQEDRFREALDPDAWENRRRERLSAAVRSSDGAALATIGLELFTRDMRTVAGRKPMAKATRCMSCHHRGGPGGAGGLVDVAYAGRNPPSLAGTALLERLGQEITEELRKRADSGGRLTVQGVSFGTLESPLGIEKDLVIRPFGRVGRWATIDEAIDANAAETMAVTLSSDERSAIREFLVSLPAPGFQPPDPSMAPDLYSRYLDGRRVFERIGCGRCHVPEWRLSDGTVVSPFTDFRRHDMGDDLAEHGVREWQTPALWGLAASAPWLHDGRALTSLDRAILAHGGEATTVREAYVAMDPEDQRRLRVFLLSLAPEPRIRVAGQ